MTWPDEHLLKPGHHLLFNAQMSEDVREVQTMHRLVALAVAHGWVDTSQSGGDQITAGDPPADPVFRLEQLGKQADEAVRFLEDLAPSGYSFRQHPQGYYGVYPDPSSEESDMEDDTDYD